MGARINVRLTPRGGRDAITRWDGATLHVRVAAAPAENAANQAMTRLIAKRARVPAGAVRVVSGATSRLKVVEVRGLEDAELRTRLDLRSDGGGKSVD